MVLSGSGRTHHGDRFVYKSYSLIATEQFSAVVAHSAVMEQIQNSPNVAKNATQPAANISALVKMFESQTDLPPPYSALFPPGGQNVTQTGMQVDPQQMAQSQSLHNDPLGQSGSQGGTPSAASLRPASSSDAKPVQSMHGQSPEGNISQSCAESQFQGERLSQPTQSDAGAAQQENQPLIFNSPLQARHLSQGNPMQMQSYSHFHLLSKGEYLQLVRRG